MSESIKTLCKAIADSDGHTLKYSDVLFFLLCFLQYDDLESSLRDSGVLVQTQKTENLEVRQENKKGLMRDDQISKMLENQTHSVESPPSV